MTPSDADRAAVKKALNDVVLPEWAKRCGAECAAKWTEMVGKRYGLIGQGELNGSGGSPRALSG